MIQTRKSDERGHANHGWLDSYHTFSFADYYDPSFMGFRSLRVINEDRIEGGAGFPTHPHRDMEIITYVVSGALEHKDSMGNAAVIKPGEVQHMSAGTGVRHSEFNHFKDKDTHLLQIWLMPNKNGVEPGYGQKDFTARLSQPGLVLVASPDGRDGSIKTHQDADLYAARFSNGDAQSREINFTLRPSRYAWLQVISGHVELNGTKVSAGDGAAVAGEEKLALSGSPGSEILLFDLP